MANALETFQKGNYALALVLLEKEIQQSPEDPVLYYHFALACFHTQNFQKTISVIQTILERFPRFAEIDRAYKLMVFSMIELRDYDNALSELEKRLYISPYDPVLLSFKAHIYEKKGNYSEAISLHRDILRYHPDSKSSLNNLGYLLLTKPEPPTSDEWKEATEALKKAVRLEPNNPAYLDSLGTLLEKMGKTTEARKALEKALSLAPNQTEILNHLAKIPKP